MPDSDPQPPKPRAVSPARWLMMLLPSLPMMLAPIVADALVRSRHQMDNEDRIGTGLSVMLQAITISAVLSMVMGSWLEKWRHGAVESFPRTLGYVLLILFTNLLVGFVGCAVTSRL